MVGVRMPEDLQDEIRTWADKQKDTTALATAIRRLVEIGLKVKTPVRPVSKPGQRLRAQELATKAIERIIDPAAPPEERANDGAGSQRGRPSFARTASICRR